MRCFLGYDTMNYKKANMGGIDVRNSTNNDNHYNKRNFNNHTNNSSCVMCWTRVSVRAIAPPSPEVSPPHLDLTFGNADGSYPRCVEAER